MAEFMAGYTSMDNFIVEWFGNLNLRHRADLKRVYTLLYPSVRTPIKVFRKQTPHNYFSPSICPSSLPQSIGCILPQSRFLGL